MQITKENLVEWFTKYNRMYFSGELKTPYFRITNSKRMNGYFSNITKHGPSIGISNYYNRTEKQFCNILIHEMIHQYIRQKGLKDTRAHHGTVFYSIADRINEDGWDIKRTSSNAGLLPNNSEDKVYNLVAFIDGHDRPFVMRYHPDYRWLLKRYFERHWRYYTNLSWFTSNDAAKFDTLPCCRRSVSGMFITKQEFENLKDKYAEEYNKAM